MNASLPWFDHGLSEDRRTLALRLDGPSITYSAEQVETLVIILAMHRAKMQPSASEEFVQKVLQILR